MGGDVNNLTEGLTNVGKCAKGLTIVSYTQFLGVSGKARAIACVTITGIKL